MNIACIYLYFVTVANIVFIVLDTEWYTNKEPPNMAAQGHGQASKKLKYTNTYIYIYILLDLFELNNFVH